LDRSTRALFVESIFKRAACRRFGLSYYLIAKISRSDHPGSYERASPSHPTLGPFIPFIEGYLEEDKQLPVKQRHTVMDVFSKKYGKLRLFVLPDAYPLQVLS